jgi:hypothetical protein
MVINVLDTIYRINPRQTDLRHNERSSQSSNIIHKDITIKYEKISMLLLLNINKMLCPKLQWSIK